jgi:hypothetical protein
LYERVVDVEQFSDRRFHIKLQFGFSTRAVPGTLNGLFGFDQ